MGAVNNIFINYPNDVFIETGSYMGNGIQMALDAGFNTIYSIELSDKYFNICKTRFKNNPNVHILIGDSCDLLPILLEKIESKITFWLDGHHSCGDTALGKYWAPLIQELEAIKKHYIKDHTIIIDDMRCWKNFNPVHGFEEKDLLKNLYEINKEFKIEYIDGTESGDILVAKI